MKGWWAMLKELLVPLVDWFSAFNIFNYITFRAAYAAVTALFISFIFGPGLIRWLKRVKIGQEVRKDGPQTHLIKSGTPTMGGLLIIIAILISVLLWQDIRNPYTWIMILSTIGFGAIGFLDDYIKVFRKSSDGIQARVKLLGQFIVSLALVLILYFFRNEHTTLLYIPFFKNAIFDMGIFYIPFGVLLIVGFSNAVNLTDGLDGLASGLMIMVGLTFAALSYLTGNFNFSDYLGIPFIGPGAELTVFSLALVGASVGFLWYNSHPAEMFMGDTGSLSLGGLIGTLALILKKEILLVIVGGVFVLEVISVILQVLYFKKTGKRIFRMAPLHHHFEKLGWDESKVVTRFWILGGLFAILALSTLKIQ
jgi:phospho-N-acetylmuramoyl-pentapeptide-transferase